MTSFYLKIFILIFAAALLPGAALAQSPDLGLGFVEGLELPAGDPRTTIVGLVRLALTFIAILAVMMVLLGGFRYMVSGGNDDIRSQAKGTIVSAIIGLVLVLSSFLIVNFIISSWENVV